jgi:hypothetical protein
LLLPLWFDVPSWNSLPRMSGLSSPDLWYCGRVPFFFSVPRTPVNRHLPISGRDSPPLRRLSHSLMRTWASRLSVSRHGKFRCFPFSREM